MKPKLTLTSKKESFLQCLLHLQDSMQRAASLLVEMIDEEPDIMNILLRENPHISPGTLLLLERVGRHELEPMLALSDAPAAKRASSLPPSAQKVACYSPIPVVQLKEEKDLVTTKRIGEMTASDACLAFDVENGRIRTVDEQRSILTNRLKKKDTRYTPDDKGVQFHRAVFFTWDQLGEIIEMFKPKPSALDIEREVKRNQIANAVHA